MCRSHYWNMREWCYKHITPRIICEKLLVDPVEVNPVEYGFHCFGGEPRFVRVHKNRATNLTVDIFTTDWQRPPFVVNRPSSGKVVARRPTMPRWWTARGAWRAAGHSFGSTCTASPGAPCSAR